MSLSTHVPRNSGQLPHLEQYQKNNPANNPYQGYDHKRPVLKDKSQTCEKCGAKMLYHDLDPQRRHNGYTCAMCGTEQTLADGSKSTIKVTGS